MTLVFVKFVLMIWSTYGLILVLGRF